MIITLTANGSKVLVGVAHIVDVVVYDKYRPGLGSLVRLVDGRTLHVNEDVETVGAAIEYVQ